MKISRLTEILCEGGVIVESGTHSELLMKGGEYARLWTIQSQQQQQQQQHQEQHKHQNNSNVDLLVTS
jgi:hypothetical protein